MSISPDTILPILTLATTAGVILYEYNRTDDLVTPLHLAWGFFGFFFLISYVYTGAYGTDSQLHPFATPDTTATTALSHLFLAFTFLTLGYYSPLPRALGDLTVKQLPDQVLPPQAGRAVGLALFIVGLLSTAIFIVKNGGLSELLAARNVWVFRTATGSLRYWLGLQIGLFAGLALYLSGARNTPWHFPAYGLGITTAIVFFAMHTRMRVVLALLLIGLYAWYADPRVQPRSMVAIGIGALLALGLFRPVEMLLQGESVERALLYVHGYLTIEPGGMFVYPDYFQGYMALVEGVPDRVGYQWGRTLLAVPWLPFELFEQMRALATDPTELTEIAVYGYDRPDTGVIASGFGVIYVNFSLPGLFLAASVYGVLFRWAYVVWQQAADRVMVGAMYFITMYYFFIMLAKTPIVFNVLLVLAVLRGLWFVIDFVPHAPFRSAWRGSHTHRLQRYPIGTGATIKEAWERSVTRRFIRQFSRAWTDSRLRSIVNHIHRR